LVLYGLNGPLKVNGVDYNGAMPAVGKVAGSGYNLSDEKVAAVLTYVRQQWGNTAGPITTDRVAAIRAKEGDRKAYVVEELLKLP
jgi:mono/diheme cytochrome c family protein